MIAAATVLVLDGAEHYDPAQNGGRHYFAAVDHTGDTKTTWHPENAVEVEAARVQFDALIKKGYTAYRVDTRGEKGEVMRSFDPDAKAMILAPALRGG